MPFSIPVFWLPEPGADQQLKCKGCFTLPSSRLAYFSPSQRRATSRIGLHTVPWRPSHASRMREQLRKSGTKESHSLFAYFNHQFLRLPGAIQSDVGFWIRVRFPDPYGIVNGTSTGCFNSVGAPGGSNLLLSMLLKMTYRCQSDFHKNRLFP